ECRFAEIPTYIERLDDTVPLQECRFAEIPTYIERLDDTVPLQVTG
ncbi:hypothetical protein GE061_020335, partial [Apolygus lucorum]